MRDDEELDGIEDILPDDIGRCAERGHGMKVGLRHPDTQRGILLTESLSGCDGRDAGHRFGRRGRVDEHVLIVAALARRRQIIADELAQAELQEAGEERSGQKDEDIGDLNVVIGDHRFSNHGCEDHDGGDPEIEGDDGEFRGEDELIFRLCLIDDTQKPRGKERPQEERADAREDEQESRPKGHISGRVDERKESRHDEGCCKIAEESESGEVLYRTAHFTGNNGCGSGSRHDKTEHQSLCQYGVPGQTHQQIITTDGKGQLDGKHNPVPFMQSQVQRIDLAEGEKQHKEDEPREYGTQGQKPFVADGTDEHREPKGIGIEYFFQLPHLSTISSMMANTSSSVSARRRAMRV